MNEQQALERLRAFVAPELERARSSIARNKDIVAWGEKNFYIPDAVDAVTNKKYVGPIKFQPVQATVLRYMFDMNRPPDQAPQTLIYSTIKKSGKTAVASLVARWITETWGPYAETICVANDMEQARGRIYDAALRSIELTPGYDTSKRLLADVWNITQRGARYLPDGGVLRAISNDYKGEAGANPTATIYTELWGFTEDRAQRLWNELTPVPTRAYSVRFVEGYAGFEGESVLWQHLWDLARKDGRRVTREELEPYGGWTYDDDPPLYINDRARLIAYIDQGEVARRMPWQTRAYYEAQAAELDESAFRRLHFNEWVSSLSEFIPKAWWDACYEPNLPPLTKKEPMVVGVDASVTGDCTAIVGVTRNPRNPREVVVRFATVFTPPPRGSLNYSTSIEPELRRLVRDFNVVQISYDPYQLHKLMTDFSTEGVAWCKAFSQAGERAKADKELYDLIRDRRLLHPGLPTLSEHIQNAARRTAKDEDTRMRIIKKENRLKIDAAVALSMASYECLRLLLE